MYLMLWGIIEIIIAQVCMEYNGERRIFEDLWQTAQFFTFFLIMLLQHHMGYQCTTAQKVPENTTISEHLYALV